MNGAATTRTIDTRKLIEIAKQQSQPSDRARLRHLMDALDRIVEAVTPLDVHNGAVRSEFWKMVSDECQASCG